MLELTSEECRVLGVLVEKAQATPDAHPLDTPATPADGAPAGAPTLSQRLAELEAKVHQLDSAMRHLCQQLGIEVPSEPGPYYYGGGWHEHEEHEHHEHHEDRH